MPDSSGSIDLSQISPEDRERLEQLGERAPEGDDAEVHGDPVDFAFTVIYKDGQYAVAPYGTPFVAERQPSDDEIYAAAAVVQKDISSKETAIYGIQLQMQQIAQIQQAQQAQRLQAGLGDLRGGH